ncbi:MAG: hypothetical protein H7831_06190 [Magnetococcus sp. WYHC-3]
MTQPEGVCPRGGPVPGHKGHAPAAAALSRAMPYVRWLPDQIFPQWRHANQEE